MQKLFLAIALSLAVAPAALAQTSGSITTHQTPLGPVTHSQTTTQVGSGTYTTHSVTPGNNTTVTPYVGATTYNPSPNTSQGTTNVSVGISIPLGSSPPRSTSRHSSDTPR